MTFSNDAILICKHYEKFVAKPYLCPSKKATIGYGATRYPNGIKVKLTDPPITEQVALELLHITLASFAKDVSSVLKVPVTQNQFDALVDFAYNVGSDIDSDSIAEGLGDSTLLKLVNKDIMNKNADWKKLITKEFSKWIWGGDPKKKLPGLVARRQTESFLFTNNIVKYFN